MDGDPATILAYWRKMTPRIVLVPADIIPRSVFGELLHDRGHKRSISQPLIDPRLEAGHLSLLRDIGGIDDFRIAVSQPNGSQKSLHPAFPCLPRFANLAVECVGPVPGLYISDVSLGGRGGDGELCQSLDEMIVNFGKRLGIREIVRISPATLRNLANGPIIREIKLPDGLRVGHRAGGWQNRSQIVLNEFLIVLRNILNREVESVIRADVVSERVISLNS